MMTHVMVSALMSEATRKLSVKPRRTEIALAVAAFAVLCAVVLATAPQLMEPDDYAYRASIVGITDGHLLTLSTAKDHERAGPRLPVPGRAIPVARHHQACAAVLRRARLPCL